VAERAATLSDTRPVYVADREGDMAALMELADTLGHPVDWLIRARHNRNLAEGCKLWDKVEASEVLGEIAFILLVCAVNAARDFLNAYSGERDRSFRSIVTAAHGLPAILPAGFLCSQRHPLWCKSRHTLLQPISRFFRRYMAIDNLTFTTIFRGYRGFVRLAATSSGRSALLGFPPEFSPSPCRTEQQLSQWSGAETCR
jgi:hypothetical protein